MSEVKLKELLEAGAHFGHQTRRWNPKMQRFIYGVRGGIHIIDLIKTCEHLQRALNFVRDNTAANGPILMVGTKRQAKGMIETQAKAAGLPYVCERWLGGMLTNWRTIRQQVSRLKKLEAQAASGEWDGKYNKKEQLDLTNEMKRLELAFGGIKDLETLPSAVFVADAVKDQIAVAEAKKLGIPVVAIVDTNADPEMVDYPIPANDDAVKTLALLIGAVANAATEGLKAHQAKQAAEEQTEAASV